MEKIIDKTYSTSLFEYARENKLVDIFYEQAKDIIEVISQSDDFRMFLTSPKISIEDKKEVVRNIFTQKVWAGIADKISQKLHIEIPMLKDNSSAKFKILDFVCLVIDKGREAYLTGIMESYCDLVREYKKIGLCEITSATELSSSQKDKLSKKLLEITAFESFEFKYKVDNTLLAGLKIKIGDTVFDSSIKNKLEQINKSLRGIKL